MSQPLIGLVSDYLNNVRRPITNIIVFGNSSILLRQLRDMELGPIPLHILTSAPSNKELFEETEHEVTILDEGFSATDLGMLTEVRDYIIQAIGTMQLKGDTRFLVVLVEPVTGLLVVEPEHLGMNKLVKSAMSAGVEPSILNTLLDVAMQLGIEGREGHPIGALFAIGPVQTLRGASKALVLNPFKGHSEENRDITNPLTIETIKEYSLLDGAIFINRKGIVSNAGRYIVNTENVKTRSGEGGRQVAARAISQLEECIAICLSTSGTLSVHHHGRMVWQIHLSRSR